MRVTQETIRKYRALLKKKAATTTSETLMGCMTKLVEVATVIYRHDGKPGWTQDIPELEKEDEKELQPLVDFLLKLRSGQQTEQTEQTEQTGGGMDELFETVMKTSKEVGQLVDSYVNQYGPTALSSDKLSSVQDDVRPLLGLPLVFPPVTGWTATFPTPLYPLNKLPISPVLLLYVANLSLDFVRLMINYVSPQSYLRAPISLVLAIMELMDGRWKAALLSAAGMFSSSAVTPGFLMKMGLGVLDVLPNQLQTDVAWITYRSMKALVVGFAVKMFLITAPFELRNKVRDLFGKVAEVTINTNALLAKAGLPSQEITSTKMNAASVQDIISKDTVLCSKEFQELVPLIKQSVLLEFIAQLAGLPTTEGVIQHICGNLYDTAIKQNFRTLGHLLAAEGLQELIRKDVDQTPTRQATVSAAKANASVKPPSGSEIQEATPVVPEATPVVPEATPAVPVATPAVSEATPAVSEEPVAVPETTPAVSEEPVAVPEATPAVPVAPPAVPEATPAAQTVSASGGRRRSRRLRLAR